MNIVTGNIVGLIASLVMVYTGLIKKKEKFLVVQMIQMSLGILSNLILGGFTGAIINGINCIRNLLCYKNKLNTKAKLIIILVATILSLTFNNLGVIGILPLISSIVYTSFISIKDIKKLKYIILFTTSLWLIYDLTIKSYAFATFDFFTIITNIIAIYQLSKKRT